MTSPAQIAANRRNAQRSTGPRTPRGKAASATNALRHGLRSTQLTLPTEDPDAYRALQQQFADQLTPEGPVEALLVQRLTASAWRLGRVAHLEAGVLAYRMREAQTAGADSPGADDPLAVGVVRDAAGADALAKLSRYERSLERAFYRALHELQRLQAVRAGQDVAPPTAVDVSLTLTGE